MFPKTSKLCFEKLSRYDRAAEAVTISIPLARGVAKEPDCLAVFDGKREIFTQRRVLSCWDDGSIKWLLTHFQVDLPGNRGKSLTLKRQEPSEKEPRLKVAIHESKGGIAVDTGKISFVIPRDRFDLLRNLKVAGIGPVWKRPFSGFAANTQGRRFSTANAGVARLEVIEGGPLRAIIEVTGRHARKDGKASLFDYRCRLCAYAGKPYIEVEYQFINREEKEAVLVKEISLSYLNKADANLSWFSVNWTNASRR